MVFWSLSRHAQGIKDLNTYNKSTLAPSLKKSNPLMSYMVQYCNIGIETEALWVQEAQIYSESWEGYKKNVRVASVQRCSNLSPLPPRCARQSTWAQHVQTHHKTRQLLR